MEILTLSIVILLVLAYIILGVYAYFNFNNFKKTLEEKNRPVETVDHSHLSYDECNKIIDDIIDDIYKNKYFINYRLREVVIIPEMDSEIAAFVKEVINAIGSKVMLDCLRYHSYEYIITRITRKGQMLFIEYTNNYKPSTK